MKKIKLTEEQRKKHAFSSHIIDIINEYKDEELLEELDSYVLDQMSYSADIMNKELLLGNISLFWPDEFDDWTAEEKLIMFDRWEVINQMVALSKLGQANYDEDDDDDNNFYTGNNGGLLS